MVIFLLLYCNLIKYVCQEEIWKILKNFNPLFYEACGYKIHIKEKTISNNNVLMVFL